MYYWLLSFLLLSSLHASRYESPKSFSHAKQVSKMLYLHEHKTALIKCDFTYSNQSCNLDIPLVNNSCPLKDKGVTFTRIVSEDFYGEALPCMNEKVCTSALKKLYSGKRCCRKSDKKYQSMEREILNIVPLLSSISHLKKTRTFNSVKQPARTIHGVKIDTHYIEPKNSQKGNIARAILYMYKKYQLDINKSSINTYLQWHALDPVDRYECKRYRVIYKIQGAENPWIKSSCERSFNNN